MSFKVAKREKIKGRIGLCGSSGSGKTFGGLMIAKGLANGGTIAFIDTEKGKSRLHVGKPGVPTYQVANLDPPYTPQKYIQLMHEAMQLQPDVLIIDSLSHAWAGEGGILEMVDRVKSGGNNFTAWRTLTPLHNKFVDEILSLPCHVIVTMRTKTEWLTEKNESGKMTVRKVGLAPIQRDGMEYEFDVVLDVDREKHTATASKDRTSLFDSEIGFTITEQHGIALRKYLDEGEDVVIEKQEPIVEEVLSTAAKNRLNTLAKEVGFASLTEAVEKLEFGSLDTMKDGEKLAAILKTKKAS
jgi:hypothetical protein